ncbi:hypothetical protein [Pedobacter metabolipauper]|uniref:Uncharacterized protein n=1 Tax=Pedobacter metabolipauper TaxID=425513 RepID=A0A4R6STX6_9SPHI|nr:hypothetical protein [Pedobacter metabolipauper]TDQ08468.1 hypothetical protein ATK78_2982 [Pedobacter metabolipauper]
MGSFEILVFGRMLLAEPRVNGSFNIFFDGKNICNVTPYGEDDKPDEPKAWLSEEFYINTEVCDEIGRQIEAYYEQFPNEHD